MGTLLSKSESVNQNIMEGSELARQRLADGSQRIGTDIKYWSTEMHTKLTNFYNEQPTVSITILIIIIIIVVLSIIILIKRRIMWNRENPVFYRNGADVSKGELIISNDDIHRTPETSSSSLFFWVNINSLGDTGKGSEDILKTNNFTVTKNNNINTLVVKINQVPIRIKIKDYPMNRWFSISLIMNDNDIEIYVDGKLIKTEYIRNFGNSLNGGSDNSGIHIGPFNGEFASLTYSSSAYTSEMIRYLHSKGPFTNSWIVRLFGYLTDVESQPQCKI